ncbi:glycosyltransferase family 2 protein [Rhizobium sp.]
MEVAKFDGIAVGTIHRLRLKEEFKENFSIDYDIEENHIIHLSFRPEERVLVLNSFNSGSWGKEVLVPLEASDIGTRAEIEIRFTEKAAAVLFKKHKQDFVFPTGDLTSVRIIASAEIDLSVNKANAAKKAPAPVSPEPEYVKAVLDEFNNVELTTAKLSARPLPDRWSPIVISVVKNEFDRLADFFRHYRGAGIERFVFVDNGSTDGTLEFLLSQSDVDVYIKTGDFNWMKKQGWINRIIKSYGYGRWYMYLDADEQIVFEDFGYRNFRDLALLMEKRGINRVRGQLVDMYDKGPLLQSSYEAHGRLSDSYPYFDKGTYKEEVYNEVVSIKGGPRNRVFGKLEPKFRPELTKYPLFCISETEYMANPHHIWPYEGNFNTGRFLAILHYKFLPDILNKIRRAISDKNYWDGSFEYQCYLKAVDQDPSLSLYDECSVRYNDPADLLDAGVIVPVNWGHSDTLQGMRSGYERRISELRGAEGMSLFEVQA